jgi:hypothetical protein
MNYNEYNEMDGDLSKLVQLLKKILKSHPAGPELSKMMDQKSFNLNLCFLTIMAAGSDELEGLSDEYFYVDEPGSGSQKKKGPKLEFKLTQNDVKFLKENGLRF